MRHRAAVVVCRQLAEEEDLDLGALTRVLGARRGQVAPVARATPVGRVAPVGRVDRVTSVGRAVPVGRVVPVGQVTSVDRAVPADRVVPADRADRATSVDPAVPAVRATSVDPAVPATSVVPVVRVTSDRDLLTPSEASVVPRGVMEQRRGAGEHLREPGGADPFRRPAASGTKGRSTTGATTRHRYGIRAKTAGASISSESGSRSNESAAGRPPAAITVTPDLLLRHFPQQRQAFRTPGAKPSRRSLSWAGAVVSSSRGRHALARWL